MQDIWEFKDPQYPQYPTEKIDMLKLIISASSNEDSIVLDSFAAQALHLLRLKNWIVWIGIDKSDYNKSCKNKLLNSNQVFFKIKFELIKQVEIQSKLLLVFNKDSATKSRI